jgi:glycogen operon protein
VAEAWDAGGLYQVGSFPNYDRWGEWNGKYRDDVRRFLKGNGKISAMSQRLQGSPDLYAKAGRSVDSSVNFITAHDGFTLADLFAYNKKHNEANAEDNRDGTNDNESWNCGVEGVTSDPEILGLRRRQMRNAIVILMMSQGVPMLLMGDEMGRSQNGNNNTYCHDSEFNWLDWDLLKTNAAFFRFVKNCIAFRNLHPVLRNHQYFQHKDYLNVGYPDISWYSITAQEPNWTDEKCYTLAFMLCGKYIKADVQPDDFIYVAMNVHWESHGFKLPKLPIGMNWHIFANTAMPSPEDIWEPGSEPMLQEQSWIMLGERSVVVLVGR